MSYRICDIQNGTVVITSTVPDDWPTASTYAAVHGGEVVSADLIAALRRGDGPADGGVPAAEFKRRLAILYYTLGLKDDATQRRWDRVLSLLDSFSVIYPTTQPVAGLIAAAVGEGLLTADAAASLAG